MPGDVVLVYDIKTRSDVGTWRSGVARRQILTLIPVLMDVWALDVIQHPLFFLLYS
jgi:hypothetical protein